MAWGEGQAALPALARSGPTLVPLPSPGRKQAQELFLWGGIWNFCGTAGTFVTVSTDTHIPRTSIIAWDRVGA